MISDPINDTECLGQITELARTSIDTEPVRALADRFDAPAELAAWIRALPQRDDTGDPDDGPRVACAAVTQRARLLPGDPNCVERSLLYLAAAERLNDDAERALMTIDTPAGLHTFPVENGEPVVLDPRVTRNAMAAGFDRVRNAAPPASDPAALVQWVVDIAAHQAAPYRNGAARVAAGARALDALFRGEPVRRNGIGDIGWLFGVANQAARYWGGQGVDAVALAKLGVQRLLAARAQRNATAAAPRNIGLGSIKFGPFRLPAVKVSADEVKRGLGTLEGVARAGARIGGRVGAIALRAKLAQYGVPPEAIDELERELQKEGISLGPVASERAPSPLDRFLLKGPSHGETSQQ